MKSREALDRDLKEVVFTVAVTAAFTLGFYSLLLASANKGKALPLTTFGVVRTATAADTEKIVLALGALAEHELVFVVLDTSTAGIDPRPVNAARGAALALADAGTDASVRLLGPRDSDFGPIVMQNQVGRFPAVLAVKEDGGIVLVTDEISEERLLNVYRQVWATTSSCNDAISDIY
jgi:hypothetical protein